MSNGWFVPVDTSFIIVIVGLAQLLKQGGWRVNSEIQSISELTHQDLLDKAEGEQWRGCSMQELIGMQKVFK